MCSSEIWETLKTAFGQRFHLAHCVPTGHAKPNDWSDWDPCAGKICGLMGIAVASEGKIHYLKHDLCPVLHPKVPSLVLGECLSNVCWKSNLTKSYPCFNTWSPYDCHSDKDIVPRKYRFFFFFSFLKIAHHIDLVEIALWGHRDDSLVQSQLDLNTALKEGCKATSLQACRKQISCWSQSLSTKVLQHQDLFGLHFSCLILVFWVIAGMHKSTLGFLNLLGGICGASQPHFLDEAKSTGRG